MRYFTFFFHTATSNSSVYFALTAHLKVSQPQCKVATCAGWGPPPEMDATSRLGPHMGHPTPGQICCLLTGNSGKGFWWAPESLYMCLLLLKLLQKRAHFVWSECNGIWRGNPHHQKQNCWMLLSLLLRHEGTYLDGRTFIPKDWRICLEVVMLTQVHVPPWHTQIFGQFHPMDRLSSIF